MRAPDGILRAIAAFKFCKALLLVVVGVGALELLRPSVAEQAQIWLHLLGSSLGPRAAQRVLAGVSGLTPKRLEAVGAGAFAYAALYGTEGVGLWRARRWAEYLTIVATASFVPFEVYELVNEVTPPRVSALLLNVAVVGYLVYRVRTER